MELELSGKLLLTGDYGVIVVKFFYATSTTLNAMSRAALPFEN